MIAIGPGPFDKIIGPGPVLLIGPGPWHGPGPMTHASHVACHGAWPGTNESIFSPGSCHGPGLKVIFEKFQSPPPGGSSFSVLEKFNQNDTLFKN